MARKTASDFFEEKETTEEFNKTDEKEVESQQNETESENEAEAKKGKVSEAESESEKSSHGSTTSSKSPVPAQTQEEYMKQYQQYMQQYQQYYAQYYNPYYTSTPGTTSSDPAYEYFTGSTAGITAPPAVSFDASRASRQMAAYFDPTKFQAVLSPEMLAAQRAQKEQQQAKLTAKEIEAFKKKKIEKKKAKNRWFYE